VSYKASEWRDLTDADVVEKASDQFGAARLELQRRLLLALGDLRTELAKARHLAWALFSLMAALLLVTITLLAHDVA
jgi:hypothetical protein